MPILNTEKYGITVYSPQQPHNPMGEVLEWSTDVFTAHDGTEQRKSIRSLPRHVLEMNFPIQAANNGRAINAIYGGINDGWLVPMWAWARPAGATAAGATGIIIDKDLADNYIAGGYALIWESADKSAVVKIAGYTGQGVTLAAPLDQHFVGAYLVPMRRGRIIGTPQRATTGHSAVLNVKFDVDDEAQLPEVIPSQFLSNDIYFDEIEVSAGGLTEETSGDINTLDYETGRRAYFMPWLNPKLSKTQRVTMLTAAEAIGFRAWLQRRAGKLKPFWRPTFESDFRRTSTGFIASALQVRDDDYFQFGGVRKHIAIRLSSGQWLPRTIVSHAGLPNYVVQLNLDAPLNVLAADIVCISYLGLHRLNTDRIEMQWNSGICVSEFTTIEITP